MNLIVDASVAVKWIVEENSSDAANAILAGDEHLFAPDLVFLEVANALTKRVNRRDLVPEQVQAGLALLRQAFPDAVPTGYLVEEASSLSLLSGHPVYDCVYLALARRLPPPVRLATADAGLARVAQRLEVPVQRIG